MAATLPVRRDANLPVELLPAKESITCEICASVYEPAPAHSYLKQSPQLALESAYMSMCHFCFRCRRPACPGCWDEVHGLCGACVEETHLKFRQGADVLPLDSTLLLPKPLSPIPQLSSLPLVCVKTGRFQEKEAVDVLDKRGEAANRGEEENSDDDIEQTADGIQVVESVSKAGPKQEAKKVGRFGRVAARIERVMTIVLSVMLALVIVLIVASALSVNVNEVVLHLLHIDIRMEIRYLVQLIQQLVSGGSGG